MKSLKPCDTQIIVERTKEALAHKKNKREWTGRIPYGFLIGDNGILEENPDEIKSIEKVKRMKRQGVSIRTIADRIGLSKSVVHRLVNINLRTLKTRYANALAV